jgi:putative ABC transport system ATP-binding protein
MTTTPAIALKNVHLTLGEGAGQVHILKGIDLEIGKSTSVGLVGPSGSGKSTLLMVMAGLERADEGSVVVAGSELGGLSEDQLALFRGRNVGIIFQSFHLVPNMTALENVAVPLELAGDADAFKKAQAELEAVGLGTRLHHYPAQMSGGEQQRVAVARALVVEPEILIADEPTGNLDDSTGAQIVDLMFSAQRDRKTTLVLVTHDPALAEKCDRVIRVRSGRNRRNHSKPGRRARAGDRMSGFVSGEHGRNNQTFRLALRFALRELRGGLKGFYIFIACIALGVAAISGVTSVSRALTEGISQEGQAILGGDLSFRLVHRQVNEDERNYIGSLGAVSEVATLRAMARRADTARSGACRA